MLSNDEFEILNKKYELSSCKTLRQFMMKCILEKDIFVLDMKMFKDMSTNIRFTTPGWRQARAKYT